MKRSWAARASFEATGQMPMNTPRTLLCAAALLGLVLSAGNVSAQAAPEPSDPSGDENAAEQSDEGSAEVSATEEIEDSATEEHLSEISIPRARGLFEAGSAAVQEGDYENAFRYFSESYELSRLPAMLFNLGSCAERMQRSSEALDFYRRYLSEVPDAQNRRFVDGRIRALEAVVAETEAEAEAEAETETETEADRLAAAVRAEAAAEREREAMAMPEHAPPTQSEDTPAAWVLLGAGGAAVIVGSVLLATGAAKRRELDKAPQGASFADFEDHASAANLQTGLGVGFLAAGLATAAVGLVIVISSGPSEDDESARLVVGMNHVSVLGSF